MRLGKHFGGCTASLAWVIAAVATAPALAKTVYVSKTGNNTNDGLTWSTAKLTVQEGLNAAVADDQIWVAAGTYIERITLRMGVALYGGLAGTETDLAQRDWATNKTILDGNQAGIVVTSPSGATTSTRIDGFTIRNGNAGQGGGISCYYSSPTIANNTVTGNTASEGGGIYCFSSSPMIANNVVSRNTASCCGGGIQCFSSSSPAIANNVIAFNSVDAGDGAGICCSDYSFPSIMNNTIIANTASNSYGGSAGGVLCSPAARIENSIIAFNSSGVYCYEGSPVLRHNCVYGNEAYDYSGFADPTGTSGNISSDPGIAGRCYARWHIQPDSPCVDAGDDTVVQAGWPDLDGQARIQGLRVDIGADESDGICPPADPNVIVRVSLDGNDSSDGSVWPLAKRTVQAGIDAAASLGGEVWVKAGMYPERITLRAFAHVYGGFAGTEENRDQRDFRSNETILDGQQGGSVVAAYYIGRGYSTIDGFTIRNGSGMGSASDRCGGGIFCNYSSLTIANNTITDNVANKGGAIYCVSPSSPVIMKNTITGNIASEGPGVFCDGSSPMIINNTITRNTVEDMFHTHGGGICCYYSNATILNNVIAANAASVGGGIYCTALSSLTVVNNTITGNSASRGGGMAHDGESMLIANNIMALNSSGVYTYRLPSTLSLRSNCAYGNLEYNYSGMADPTGTYGNISADPKLAAPAYGNTHLQPGSPCVDAGDCAFVRSGSMDIDSQSRVIGLRVDIGADESDGTVWPLGPYTVVRVSPSGDDANDGSSWPAAKRTAQAGIDVVCVSGGEVWVQAGTYDERIRLHPFTHLYGGFTGTETTRDSRDSKANVTILDGQQGGSVVTVLAGCRVSTIDGFTVRNGNGRVFSTYRYGGGIYCYASCPTIANNTIGGNTVGDCYAACGGGICCFFSSPTITNSAITGNTASGSYVAGGGGVYCYYSSPTITNNIISRNALSAPNGYGGGIYCTGESSPIIANNTISANTVSGSSVYGGGIYCTDYSSPTIADTIVAFNSSGIYRNVSGSLILRHNCVFSNATYDYAGLTNPTGTNGNISADPLFVDPSSGNYRLTSGSPCIDAGDNTAVPADTADLDGDGDVAEPIPFDLASTTRFFDDPLALDTGLGAPPIVDMGAYEYAPVILQSSNPATGRSLWRNQKNIIRLTFDADIVAPDVGAVVVQEMIAGGAYGEDLSAGFTFAVENDGQGQPRVLKIRETASSLQHRKWYAVRNTGDWTGVAPFTVQYVVQVGDANNDGRVLNTDFGLVNAAIPTFSTTDDDRRDLNGDGRILNTDFGVLNSKIPSFPVARPTGH